MTLAVTTRPTSSVRGQGFPHSQDDWEARVNRVNLNGGVDYLPQTSEYHQALFSSALLLGIYLKPPQP